MTVEESVRLTAFSHGAGCACKVGPSDLAQVLRRLQPTIATDAGLLVGSATGDDAAVYQIDDHTALVFTTDFFTPIVDDAYDWGRIAAANALSDVYAMGGRPILCLNLVGWPVETLPLDLLALVLDGGSAVAAEAGAIVAGGHTIDDREPKYGMAVVGFAHPDRIVTNARARPGDVLVLTKPLGIGVIATGLKRGLAPASVVDDAVATMARLNRSSAEAMLDAGVRAATDVTGFGLLGHLQKMMEASGASGELYAAGIPVIEGARELVAAGAIAGGTRRNIAHVEPWVDFDEDVAQDDRVLLADAQTSGGLIIACDAARLDELLGGLERRGERGTVVGVVAEGPVGRIRVRATAP